jgi:ABC-type multidrug transport system fused ATPase/permease subunit
MDAESKPINANEFDCLKKLWEIISARRRVQFLLLVLMILFVSILEAVSIASVVPLVSSVVAPNHTNVSNTPFISFIGKLNGSGVFGEKLLFLRIFIITSTVSGLSRILLLWWSNKISFGVGSEVSTKIFSNTLNQPYEWHLNHNSSEIVSTLTSKISILLYNVINPVFTIISSIFFVGVIGSSLLVVSPVLSVKIFAWLGSFYGVVLFFTRKRLVKISYTVSIETEQLVRYVQEALGGIREVILDHREIVLLDRYVRSDQRLRDSQSQIQFLSQSPRYAIETVGLIIVSIVAYSTMDNENRIPEIAGSIAGLALGAQRLLPIIQQGYQSWSFITGAHRTVLGLLELAGSEYEIKKPKSVQNIAFSKYIELKNVSYNYNNTVDPVLSNISYKIPRGCRLGITGKTGSGKSTIINLLIGLLEPTTGGVLVDGVVLDKQNIRAWQSKIAHVPQTIFLIDGSIIENVVLLNNSGANDLDTLKTVLVQAGLWHDVQKMPNGVNTLVGERGVRLSGGQRQRIGIARALYKKAEIIILDEATSALDTKTEEEVMESVYQLPGVITLIIIAHRLSTLNRCDKIIDVNARGVVDVSCNTNTK